MKKLQNNFTTLEQSKRLLELGVPADSADCWFMGYGFGKGYSKLPHVHPDRKFFSTIDYPCWSVGRLIEICKNCYYNRFTPNFYDASFIHYMFDLNKLIDEIKMHIEFEDLDFSKLEE